MKGHPPAVNLAPMNEILESVLSNIGDAVIVAGRDGKFLILNPAARRLLAIARLISPGRTGRVDMVSTCRTR